MLGPRKSTFLLAVLLNCYVEMIRSRMICTLNFGSKVMANAEITPATLSQENECGELIIKEGKVNTEYHCLENCFTIQNCYMIFYNPALRWCILYLESASFQLCFSDPTVSSPDSSYYAVFPRQNFRNEVSENYVSQCLRHFSIP